MDKKFVNELAEVIASLNGRGSALVFLKNILTPDELEEMSRRLQIFKLLAKGISQREVAKKLNVSIGTVSRGARELKYGEPGLEQILKNWWRENSSRRLR